MSDTSSFGQPPPAPPSGQPGYGPQGGYLPPEAPGGYPPMAGQAGVLSPADERTWGMLAHISAIIASVVGLSFLGPLLVMLIQGPKSAFVRRQAVEALNFQITVYIAAAVSGLLILVLIGIVLLPLVLLAWLILSIVAGVAASRGEDYRYPLNIRLVH